MNSIFEEDIPVDKDTLGRLGGLIRIKLAKDKEVEDCEEKLKVLKAEQRKLSQVDIPNLMDEIGLSSVTTMDGKQVIIKDTLTASLPKKRKREIADWLKSHGLGSLVKNDVIVMCGNDEEMAHDIVDIMSERDLLVAYDVNINTTSVKAAVREMLENGEDVPMELLGMNNFRETIVK